MPAHFLKPRFYSLDHPWQEYKQTKSLSLSLSTIQQISEPLSNLSRIPKTTPLLFLFFLSVIVSVASPRRLLPSMPFKDLVASTLLPPPDLPPIFFAGERPSRRRPCRTVWPTTSSTRSSSFPRTAAGMPPSPRWCFTSPPATALPLSTVAGGGSCSGTVCPLGLNRRLEVPTKAVSGPSLPCFTILSLGVAGVVGDARQC